MTEPILWLAGKHVRKAKDGIVWEFGGVFDTEEKAIAACHTDKFFIAPVPLNKVWSPDPEEWPGAYYPRLEDKPTEGVA